MTGKALGRHAYKHGAERSDRSHVIYSGMLLNETDLSCVYSDFIPDLSEPENMKTYSFNYSGQLCFFFFFLII